MGVRPRLCSFGNAKVGEAKVGEAKFGEAKVGEAKVGAAKVFFFFFFFWLNCYSLAGHLKNGHLLSICHTNSQASQIIIDQ